MAHFQKGVSGNPKGRPPRKRLLDAADPDKPSLEGLSIKQRVEKLFMDVLTDPAVGIGYQLAAGRALMKLYDGNNSPDLPNEPPSALAEEAALKNQHRLWKTAREAKERKRLDDLVDQARSTIATSWPEVQADEIEYFLNNFRDEMKDHFSREGNAVFASLAVKYGWPQPKPPLPKTDPAPPEPVKPAPPTPDQAFLTARRVDEERASRERVRHPERPAKTAPTPPASAEPETPVQPVRTEHDVVLDETMESMRGWYT